MIINVRVDESSKGVNAYFQCGVMYARAWSEANYWWQSITPARKSRYTYLSHDSTRHARTRLIIRIFVSASISGVLLGRVNPIQYYIAELCGLRGNRFYLQPTICHTHRVVPRFLRLWSMNCERHPDLNLTCNLSIAWEIAIYAITIINEHRVFRCAEDSPTGARSEWFPSKAED